MKKSYEELQDEALIGEGGNICDISIDKLRSPTMKKLHKSQCHDPKAGKERDSGMQRAAKKAGMSRANRMKLYNDTTEGYQETSNLVDLVSKTMDKMIKAMKKDDFKSVTKLYKELGNIIK